ncbi:MAG: hypothetical protein JO257_36670 [Deltaproteobacteria bacterium]|nr:hypothetical protein [Deltaproteobacteria bacterium]
MDRKPELRLPTYTVTVRLAVVGHEPTGVELFLTEDTHGRSDTIDKLGELLDEPTRFVPVKGPRAVRLLAKRSIAWLAVQREELSADHEFDDVPSEVMTLYDRQHHVFVELTTGTKLEGMLFDSAPSDRPRVIDHLNGLGNFVRLWTSDEHYLINKEHILHVTEQE